MKRDSSATGSRSSDSEKGSSEKLKAVLKKAKADPNDREAWDELEAIAAETQKPDDVAAAYRKALASAPSPELATNLGQRGCASWRTGTPARPRSSSSSWTTFSSSTRPRTGRSND